MAAIGKIIAEVEKRPILWNHSEPGYTNDDLKSKEWGEIAKNLDFSVDTVITRWNTLRNMYVEMHETLKASTSTPETVGSKWKFYKSLRFLESQIGLDDQLVKTSANSSKPGGSNTRRSCVRTRNSTKRKRNSQPIISAAETSYKTNEPIEMKPVINSDTASGFQPVDVSHCSRVEMKCAHLSQSCQEDSSVDVKDKALAHFFRFIASFVKTMSVQERMIFFQKVTETCATIEKRRLK